MKELIVLMDQVQTSGTFSVGGTLPSILPGLHVHGVGPLGLPLTEHQAQALIQVSELAPYGRGEETIVDPEVRRRDRKSTRLNSSHSQISYAVFCLKKKKKRKEKTNHMIDQGTEV